MVRNVGLKLLLSLISLVVVFAGLEVFLRVFQLFPDYTIKHEWHDYRKNVINSLGIRDVEHSIEKPSNTFRIAFVGDSFAEAWGVPFEKGYSQVLTEMLNRSSKDTRYEAIVCAKWGHNTKEELRAYIMKCAQFNPDLVIIGYVLNDAEGDKTSKKRKEFLYSLQIKKPEGVWLWCYDHFALYRFFYLKKEYLRIRHAWVKGYDKMYSDSSGFRETKRALLEFKQITNAANQKLLVALLPTLDYKLDENNPFEKYYLIMLDFLQQHKIHSCYIFPYFRGKDTIDFQVNPGYDSHPNEEGHRIIARALYDCYMGTGIYSFTKM